METWDAIETRRNVRAFTDQPIPAAVLDKILEAGRRSPSASNTQPWDFVLVTERDLLVRLAETWQGARHVATSAATIVLVAPVTDDERRRAMIEFDLGQATMAMMLVAADLGVGTGHAAIGEHALAAEILGVPDDHICLYFIALGYPADRNLKPIRNPKRRDFDDVVHREHW
jgi:nitroreductase